MKRRWNEDVSGQDLRPSKKPKSTTLAHEHDQNNNWLKKSFSKFCSIFGVTTTRATKDSTVVQTDNTITQFNIRKEEEYQPLTTKKDCNSINQSNINLFHFNNSSNNNSKRVDVDIVSLCKENDYLPIKIKIGNCIKFYYAHNLKGIPWFANKEMNYIDSYYIDCSYGDGMKPATDQYGLDTSKQITLNFKNVKWTLQHFDLLRQLSVMWDQKLFYPCWQDFREMFSLNMFDQLMECDKFFGKNDLNKRIISTSKKIQEILEYKMFLDEEEFISFINSTNNDTLRLVAAITLKRKQFVKIGSNMVDKVYNDPVVFHYEWLDDGMFVLLLSPLFCLSLHKKYKKNKTNNRNKWQK